MTTHTLKDLSRQVSRARNALGEARHVAGTHGTYGRGSRSEPEALELAARWARAAAVRSIRLERMLLERRAEILGLDPSEVELEMHREGVA